MGTGGMVSASSRLHRGGGVGCYYFSLVVLTLLSVTYVIGIPLAEAGETGTGGTGGGLKDGCSRFCQCHYMDDNLSAHCVRMNLLSVPQDIPHNVTILDLSMNNITLLRPDTFNMAFPMLHRLDLRMNGLSDIRPGVWSGMPLLTELGLDHNELMHLRAGMFSDLASLSVLSMNNNKIAAIDNATFDGLVLKHLNLHDNNPLQVFEAGTFSGGRVETLSLDRCALNDIHVDAFMPLSSSLKNIFFSHNLRPLYLPPRLLQGLDLATLWLSDNKLTDLSFLSHTKALHLDLSNNPLGEIDLGSYLEMEHVELFNLSETQLKDLQISGGRILFNLQELDISDNFLSNLEGTLFQRMPSLTRLDISGNQLHYIGASLHLILYQLEFWDLTGNRLLCDCRLEWFRRWASNQNKTHLQGAVCGLPHLEPVVGAAEFSCMPPTILRISSDAVEHTWHLQCDAEGWPTPRITWSYNISRHIGVRVEERWIAFHGHPYRNSSMLIITDQWGSTAVGDNTGSQQHSQPIALHRDYCFHFICSAFNSEGHDRTEYVHCAERTQPSDFLSRPGPHNALSYPSGGSMDLPLAETLEDQVAAVRGGTGKRRSSNALNDDQNSNVVDDLLPARRQSDSGRDPGGRDTPPVGAVVSAHKSDSIQSMSVGLATAALICLLALVLLGAILYSRRRGERSLLARGNPGWEQPGDGGPGEGMTDSTKCLVEHNEGADKATFSMDTV